MKPIRPSFNNGNPTEKRTSDTVPSVDFVNSDEKCKVNMELLRDDHSTLDKSLGDDKLPWFTPLETL